MVDPFADSIENNVESPVTNEETSYDVEVTNRRYGGVSVTFKFKGEFSSPWVVVHEESAEAALEVTYDPKFKELLDHTQKISRLYDGSLAAPVQSTSQNRSQGRSQGGQSTNNNAGRGAPSKSPRRPKGPPPGVDQEMCEHGKMNYVTGNRNGKDWAAWGCPGDGGCWEFIND